MSSGADPTHHPEHPTAGSVSERRAPSIVTVGLSNLDHVFGVERFPPNASRTPAQDYIEQGGGPAATAAVAAARLGGKVALCALHGDDRGAEVLEAELRSHGVATHLIRRVEGARTWVSAVLVTPEGERWIFPYRDPALLQARAWDPAGLDGADCVLTDVRHPVQTKPLLEEARRRGIPVVGDFSNGDHWELAAYIDHLIVSEECAREVAGTAVPADALPRLRQREDQVVGVTLGERGYAYLEGDRLTHLPALAVEVVDTTGAGDVFHGAYAFGIASGWPIRRCAQFSSAAAALSCTRMGGRAGIPGLDEVLERMRAQRSAANVQGQSDRSQSDRGQLDGSQTNRDQPDGSLPNPGGDEP